jgi:hypothetical protein
MARVTLTKLELESNAGKEFIAFIDKIASDGVLSVDEISSLLSAVESGGRFSSLMGSSFLRETILEIIDDGKIEQYEIEKLKSAISRMLPKRIRDGFNSYSKEEINLPSPRRGLWQSDPASDKQLDLMLKLGIGFHLGVTKGEASELISNYITEKESRPTARQMMILRFFDKMDYAEKSKAEVSDWMDQWYAEDYKRRDAWEMYKQDCGGDIDDPDLVELGVGLSYMGGSRPQPKIKTEKPKVDFPTLELLPHLRPRLPERKLGLWEKLLIKLNIRKGA